MAVATAQLALGDVDDFFATMERYYAFPLDVVVLRRVVEIEMRLGVCGTAWPD